MAWTGTLTFSSGVPHHTGGNEPTDYYYYYYYYAPIHVQVF